MLFFRSAWAMVAVTTALTGFPVSAQVADIDMRPRREKIVGMHTMNAVVNSVDKKSGLVDVEAEGLKLIVHFPPKSLDRVNPGDRIILHMGFSQP